MHTVKLIDAGRVKLAIRSNGNVYVCDSKETFPAGETGENFHYDQHAKLAATSPVGCNALAKGFKRAEDWLRNNPTTLIHRPSKAKAPNVGVDVSVDGVKSPGVHISVGYEELCQRNARASAEAPNPRGDDRAERSREVEVSGTAVVVGSSGDTGTD